MTKVTRRRLVQSGATGVLGALAAPSLALRADQALAHGDLVAEALARPRHVGRARRRAHQNAVRRALDIAVHAAGEVVPAFEVLDAVGGNVAEMGHTASFYWQGKMPAAAFFTTVPFGLTPGEHVAWVDAGGGQALWDELYAPFGVKPFMGGNTGVCMGGWFRNEIKSKADLGGTKIRSLGLGGEVYRRLGATPQTTPPAEILTSLQSGVIDAVEFVGPGTDIALGLYRVAPFYYYPGFNKPNGTGECIVSLNAWNALDAELKSIVAHACAVEANFALAEMERLNTEALAALTGQHRVQLRAFPQDLIAAARGISTRRAGRSRRREAPSRARCMIRTLRSANAPARGRGSRSRPCWRRGRGRERSLTPLPFPAQESPASV